MPKVGQRSALRSRLLRVFAGFDACDLPESAPAIGSQTFMRLPCGTGKLNPRKELGRALMSGWRGPEGCLEPVEGGFQRGSRSFAWIMAVSPISSMKPATR